MLSTDRVLVFPVKDFFRIVSKRTVPSIFAWRVWSLPVMTFRPGRIFIPRCRTITSPADTRCPSPRFTPRYCGFESLRLFAEPPAFLCAIWCSIYGMLTKFKVRVPWMRVLAMALLALSTFILGGLFVYFHIAEVKVSQGPAVFTSLEVEGALPEVLSTGAAYASSRGSRYYPRHCTAGSSLSPENVIWFPTVEAAEAAGYTLAKGCQ